MRNHLFMLHPKTNITSQSLKLRFSTQFLQRRNDHRVFSTSSTSSTWSVIRRFALGLLTNTCVLVTGWLTLLENILDRMKFGIYIVFSFITFYCLRSRYIRSKFCLILYLKFYYSAMGVIVVAVNTTWRYCYYSTFIGLNNSLNVRWTGLFQVFVTDTYTWNRRHKTMRANQVHIEQKLHSRWRCYNKEIIINKILPVFNHMCYANYILQLHKCFVN
jgi:hypothetical protein